MDLDGLTRPNGRQETKGGGTDEASKNKEMDPSMQAR
uniref:Uncharacterized protein n=1 Tax=Setaria italica TaxID=4555 RepID=K3XTZ6_SETIT